MVFEIDTPFRRKNIPVKRARWPAVGDEFANIKTNAASANHRDPVSNRLLAEDDINIADHFGMIDPVNIGHARRDAGGNDHLVKPA